MGMTFLHKAARASENFSQDMLILMFFIWYIPIFGAVMIWLDWKGVSWLAVISYYLFNAITFILQIITLLLMNGVGQVLDGISGGGFTIVILFFTVIFLWLFTYVHWILAKVLLFGNSVLFSLLNAAFDATKSVEGTLLGSFPISSHMHAMGNSLSEVLISTTIRIFVYYGGTVDQPIDLPLATAEPTHRFLMQNVTSSVVNATEIIAKTVYHPMGSWDFIADFYTLLFIFSWALLISFVLGYGVHPVLRPTYFIPAGCILAALILQANDDPEDKTRVEAYIQWLTLIAFPYLLTSYLLKLYRQTLVGYHAAPGNHHDYGQQNPTQNPPSCCVSMLVSILSCESGDCGEQWQTHLLGISFPCRECTYATMRECHCVADGFYNQCKCCNRKVLTNETLDTIDEKNLNALMCCLMSKAELQSAKIEEHVIMHVRPHHLSHWFCPTPPHLLSEQHGRLTDMSRLTSLNVGPFSSSSNSISSEPASRSTQGTSASTLDEEEEALVRPSLMRTASSKVRRSDTNEVVFYEESCIICMEPYQAQEDLRILLCGHVFHKKCSDEWLKTKHSCPLCKRYIPSSRIGEITHALFA
jgi:hypothetical protein